MNLEDREQLRPLPVVSTDLVISLCNALDVVRRLCLHHDNGDAVDKEDHVRADGLYAVRELQLVGNMEGVGLRVVGINQADVAFPPLGLHEDRLQPLQPLPGLQVRSEEHTSELQS